MKKLIFTLSLCATVISGAFAQNCYSGLSSVQPKLATGTAGLSPVSDSLPCQVQGVAVDQKIYFENYTTAPIVGLIDKLTIDSIGNLPAGLCWKSTKAGNTFLAGETGVIQVTGTTNAPAGQYKLVIKIKVYPKGSSTAIPGDAETLAGLRFYVRIKTAAAICCTPIDTVAGKTNFFIAAPVCAGINDATTDIKSLTVVPNPFTTTAQVNFFAENEANYTARLTNVIGSEVLRREVAVQSGANNITLERGNLLPGVYLFSLTNANGSITKRVVIE